MPEGSGPHQWLGLQESTKDGEGGPAGVWVFSLPAFRPAAKPAGFRHPPVSITHHTFADVLNFPAFPEAKSCLDPTASRGQRLQTEHLQAGGWWEPGGARLGISMYHHP